MALQKHPIIRKLTILSGSLAGLKFPREFIVIWKKEIYFKVHQRKSFFQKKREVLAHAIFLCKLCSRSGSNASVNQIHIVNLASRLKSNLQSRFLSRAEPQESKWPNVPDLLLSCICLSFSIYYSLFALVHLLFNRQASNLLR